MTYDEFMQPYLNSAMSSAGAMPNFNDYTIADGQEGDYAANMARFNADTDAWNAKVAGLMNNDQISQDFTNSRNPWVTVSTGAMGVPGMSLRQGDYDREKAKFTSEMTAAGADIKGNGNFDQLFSNWLRNNYAPSTYSDGARIQTGQYADNPGFNLNNQDALISNQKAMDEKNRAERKNSIGAGIVGLSRGLVLSGLGASALSGLGLGSLGGLAETGMNAGEAMGSGFGSNLLSNFATNTALKGALTGAAGGYASTGDLAGALKGGALGGLTGGFGNSIASGVGITSAPGQSAFTGALTGASGGLATGNTKNALLGGAMGGAGGYVSGGGLGEAAGTPLDVSTGIAGAQGPTMGTGVTGALTRNIPGLGGLVSDTKSAGSLGGLSNVKSFISPIASVYSGYTENKAIDDATKKMLASGDRAALGLQPYNQIGLNAQQALSGNLAKGFNPSDLSSDPGYQFRVAESQKALDRSLSSTGMTQSGAAIKAAQDRAQGMAATEYGDAYNRWLAQNQQLSGLGSQGLQAAGATGNIYQNMGNVQGASALAKADSKNKTIASILAGIFG